MNYIKTEFATPLKLNIELTGPSYGFCDLPLGRLSQEQKILDHDKLEEAVEEGIKNKVLMYSLLLMDHTDIYQPEIAQAIEVVYERTRALGLLKSLLFPVNVINSKDDLAKLKEELNSIETRCNFDIIGFFLPLALLVKYQTAITQILDDLAINYAAHIKLYTDLPATVEELDDFLLPSLNGIVNSSKVWKSFNMGLILRNHDLLSAGLLKHLEEIAENGDYTFFFQPPLNPCILQNNDEEQKLLIRGYCPSGYSVLTYTVEGEYVPCLYMREKPFTKEAIWGKWGELENTILYKEMACAQCAYVSNKCNGLCEIYRNTLSVARVE